MPDVSRPFSDSDPAPYPGTSPTELLSKTTLEGLLDPVQIKPEIRVLDKYPNSDGKLEITAESQVPVGFIDIQLKTLAPSDLHAPSFSVPDSISPIAAKAFCRPS